MIDFFDDRLGEWNREIQFLKGVGPKLAPYFLKLGIRDVAGMLLHFPRRYEDRRALPPLRALRVDQAVTVRGRIVDVESRATRSRMTMVSAVLDDGTGQVVLTWFNQPWLSKKLRSIEGEMIAFGTVKASRWGYEIASPEFEIVEPGEESDVFGAIVPVYAATDGLNQKQLRRAAKAAVEAFTSWPDPFPQPFREKLRLMEFDQAIRNLHRPPTDEALANARRRIAFQELFLIQLLVQMRRYQTSQEPGISFPISQLGGKEISTNLLDLGSGLADGETLWDDFGRIVPFDLTDAQRRVIRDIWKDMEQSTPMNRLVQGDVGSGKTIVAAAAMLAAVRCGWQTALMAPTEILAEQHAQNLRKLFEPLGLEVTFLAGKLGSREAKKAKDSIASGASRIAVGTHALIQSDVKFAKLGLAVIDEQHRFGVMQRVTLRQKSEAVPDVLVMTATPIPRTLAMTVYGDLDVSVIDELPPGRKPIKTHWRKPDQRPKVYDAVRELLQQGRQAYFVCPAIEESEKLQTQAAIDLHYRLQNQVYPEFQVDLLHGQMKSAEKEAVMARFRAGDSHVLVATVVIEVGVDVPNASVMVIEDANRFGLSQLHQIRGRVGRGEHQSFCILIAEASTEDAQQRLTVMVETEDGFKISEADMEIRGPGNLLGTEQSGLLNFKVADLVRDMALLEQARKSAQEVAKHDPHLESAEWRAAAALLKRVREEGAWISVS